MPHPFLCRNSIFKEFIGYVVVFFEKEALHPMHVFSRPKVNIIVSLLIILSASFALAIAVRPNALAAAPSITLSVSSGPPTSSVNIGGISFGASETVSINIDTNQIGTATTDNTGGFSIGISIPGSALPGNHTVLALGQNSGISAQAVFLVQTNWSMYGYDPQHTHYNPYENVINPSNVSNLIVDWTVRSSAGGDFPDSPAVANGVVYIGSGDHRLYAIDAKTGATIWITPRFASAFNWSPAVANSIVYDGVGGSLYAIDAKTGATIWSYKTGGSSASPTVANGVVYAESATGKLYAINATTGAKLWSYSTGSSIYNSAPAVANGIVYTVAQNGLLYAIKASTGKKLWSYTTGAAINSSPAVVNGKVYIGSQNDNVYAIDANAGTLIWSYPTGNQIFSSPAVANGVVYISSTDGKMYAIDANAGTLIWSYNTNIPTNGFGTLSSFSVANGVVYIGSWQHILYAFDASSGSLLWTYNVGNSINSSPAVVDGVVYTGSENATVFAFHLPTTT
jgi:outer membrane protein assembly factor BamB